jgi:hypothetical protein
LSFRIRKAKWFSWDLISNLRWISHCRKIASLVIENCCWLVPKAKSKEIWKEREKFESIEKKVQHYFMNIKKNWTWDSVDWGSEEAEGVENGLFSCSGRSDYCCEWKIIIKEDSAILWDELWKLSLSLVWKRSSIEGECTDIVSEFNSIVPASV